MVRTYGLTHIALGVRDPARSARFYQDVLGAEVVYSSPDFVQVQTPGSRDVIVFERATDGVGSGGGVAHFGFRLVDPADIALAASEVERAGGTVRETGEFVPGEPYLFATDVDGYDIEIWYEIPTPVDPPAPSARLSA
jgi:catechol 2,3-dioxygenase-like lactoylglutathione lyase family enzyme